jgi:hypothetical protein
MAEFEVYSDECKAEGGADGSCNLSAAAVAQAAMKLLGK